MTTILSKNRASVIAFTKWMTSIFAKESGSNNVMLRLAVTVLVLYGICHKISSPPRHLRRLPQASFFKFLKAVLLGKPVADIAKEITLPAASKSEHGIYTRFDHNGWAVHVVDPVVAKTLLLRTNLFPKADVWREKDGTLSGKFFLGSNVVFSRGEDWKLQRKIVNPAFHKSLPIELFGRLSQKLFTVMDAMDSTVDFHDLTTRFTLDAIGISGFGFDFNAIGDQQSKWVTSYNSIMRGIRDPLFAIIRILERRFLYLFPARARLHQEASEFHHMLQKIIEHKRKILQEKSNDGNDDILSMMIQAQQESGEVFPDEKLLSNLCIFFLAGHDTTSNALACAVYYLAVNQDMQRKARDEAIKCLGEEPQDIIPSQSQLHEMPYIHSIIKESLRMNAPINNLAPREATQDTILGDTVIPKGTRVVLNVFELQTSPKIWENPQKFDPERFSPGGEAEKGLGLNWLPFSNGSRQCIGMNFSMNEQKVLLPMLLRKFEWRLPEDSIHKESLITKGFILSSPKDLTITFTKRY
ncbi:cytochrome P450 [Fennellomyces sp. T-0311]|nr:cytochrome P450 [Fennellomyces sp. T-0311]